MLNKNNVLIVIVLFQSIFIHENAFAQLHVISSVKKYKQYIANIPEAQLLEIKTVLPATIYDLRYTTKNNFTKHKLYPITHQAYLSQAALIALSNVQKELEKRNRGIIIFDAYRPHTVSKKMWKIVQDERYVANPSKGSNHNRGIAVDLTLIDLNTNQELNMGTAFDNFTDTAHHTFTHLPDSVLQNRKLLKTIMEQCGFKSLSSEWWHYSFDTEQSYEVLDISFKKLRGILKHKSK